jgi:hypothetical protein
MCETGTAQQVAILHVSWIIIIIIMIKYIKDQQMFLLVF